MMTAEENEERYSDLWHWVDSLSSMITDIHKEMNKQNETLQILWAAHEAQKSEKETERV